MPKRVTPLGALVRGMLAGAVGSLAQDLFFRATKKVQPQTSKDVFEPPEGIQRAETATETVARRFSEGLLKRPLGDEAKREGARLVHIGFGAAWGGLYGLARESLPRGAGPLAKGLVGLLGFPSLVWVAGDNLILPAFKLAAPATAYPVRTHVFAWTAHLAYGAAVFLAYEALRPRTVAVAAGGLSGIALQAQLRRRLPRRFYPAISVAVNAITAMRRRDLFGRGREAIDALRS